MAITFKVSQQNDPLALKGRNLTVAIYWHPRSGPSATKNGHSALILDVDKWLAAPPTDQTSPLPPQWTNNEWYVSWMGGQIDWTPKVGSKGGNKGVFTTFFGDSANWGGEQVSTSPGYSELRWPTRWVAVSGLDTDAMRDAWDAARMKKGAHWNLISKNCATMVHTIMKAGGGDGLATGHKKQLVWWPSDIIRYAKSMTGHVYKKSSDAAAPFL